MYIENCCTTYCSNSQTNHAAFAAWVNYLNTTVKEIKSDLEDLPDDEDFDRASFDQVLEQGLQALLQQCPVDPFSLNLGSHCNPYLKSFIGSLEEEVVQQDVNHFQQVHAGCLLQKVRESLERKAFYDELENLKRNERATSKSLLRYILDLKAAYSKLMIIRLDLYTDDAECSLRDWERLKKYVAERYMTSHVGYAVKFEYGETRGVHMHTLLFFNGSVVRKDVKMAKAIGEYWKASVTAGRGTYSNCNAPEHLKRMRYPAVGTFHQFDERTLKGLGYIASYLTEQDLVVRFAVPGLSRTLRKGSIDKEKRSRIERRMRRFERDKESEEMGDLISAE